MEEFLTADTYYIAHNGIDIYIPFFAKIGQTISTGQPFLESFDSSPAFNARCLEIQLQPYSSIYEISFYNFGDQGISEYSTFLNNLKETDNRYNRGIVCVNTYNYTASDARSYLTTPINSGGRGWTIVDYGLGE